MLCLHLYSLIIQCIILFYIRVCSGESAKGKYTIESVRTMNSIVQETERWVSANLGEIATGHIRKIYIHNITTSINNNYQDSPFVEHFCFFVALKFGESTREALARAVVEASRNVNAKCIFVITQTGETSQDISKFRPNVPVV